MPKPDLAIMTYDLAISGVTRNTLRIANAALKSGLKVELWVAQATGQLLREVPEDLSLQNLGLQLGDAYTARERKQSSLGAVPALAGLLAGRHPRIVLSAGNHFHGTAAGAFRRLRKNERPRLLGRVSNSLPQPQLFAPNSLLRALNARRKITPMDRIIAVSRDIQSQLTESYKISQAKVELIPNGIDIDKAAELASEPILHPWFLPDAAPVILGVGRLVPHKRFDLLIRAFAEARKQRDMRLILVGDGPPEVRQMLVSLAEELKVAQDVWLAGFVANPLPFYRAASVFVLPSDREGMSNALLEAMAAGCKIIAVPSSGTAELLENGRYGLLVPQGDWEALAAGLMQVVAEDPDIEALRERVSEYDLQASTKKYLRLFQAELESRPTI